MLSNERVRLRAIERRDLPTIVRWLNDPVVSALLARSEPISLAAEERWHDAMLRSTTDVVFAIDAADAFIGTCGLHGIDWRHRHASAGIMLGEAGHRGRGLGGAAMTLLVHHAFASLGLHRVELEVLTTNTPAVRCYERVGFVSEGVREGARYLDGAFVDLRVMRVLATAWPPSRGRRRTRRADA